jgi:hypothetical protein
MNKTYQATMPDGSVFELEVPDSYTDEQANEFLQAHIADYTSQQAPSSNGLPKPPPSVAGGQPLRVNVGSEDPPADAPLSTGETIGAGIGTVVDGAFPGLSGVVSGSAGVVGNAYEALTGQGDFDPLQAWNTNRDAANQNIEQFYEENPNTATGLTGLGMVGSMFIPGLNVLKAAQGASKARVLMTGAGNAAIEGGIYGTADGAMTAENLSDIPERMALGGLAGAAVGGLFVPAVHGAVGVARNVKNNIPGLPSEAAARAQSERLQNRALANSNMRDANGNIVGPATPRGVYQETMDRQAMGVPAMPADAVPNMQRLLGVSVQGQGPSATAAREALQARQAAQRDRVRDQIGNVLGPTDNIQMRSDQIVQDANAAASPFYEQAKQIPTVTTPGLQDVMRSAYFPQILQQAVRNLTSDSRNIRDPRQIGFTFNPDGSVSTDLAGLSTEGWIEVQKAARQVSESLRAPGAVPGRTMPTSESRGVGSTAGHLADEIGAQNAPYNTARTEFADEIAGRDALEIGADFPGSTGQQAEAAYSTIQRYPQGHPLAGLPVGNAADMNRLGATSALDQAASRGTPATNVAQNISIAIGSQDPRKIAVARQMYGDDVVDDFMRRMGAENQAWSTQNTALGNSQTQPRQALTDAISEATRNPGLAQFLTSGWKGAVISNLFTGQGAGVAKFKEDVMNRIAEVWGATDPQDIAQGLQALIDRARSDRAFAETLNNAGVSMARLTAMLMASQSTEQTEPIPVGGDGSEPIELPRYEDGSLFTGEYPGIYQETVDGTEYNPEEY